MCLCECMALVHLWGAKESIGISWSRSYRLVNYPVLGTELRPSGRAVCMRPGPLSHVSCSGSDVFIPTIDSVIILFSEDCGKDSKVTVFIGRMVHTDSPSTRELESGRSGIQGQPWLHCEFETTLHDMRHYLQKQAQVQKQVTLFKVFSYSLSSAFWNSLS